MAAQEVRDRYRSEVVIQYTFPDCVYGISQRSFQWANKTALENAGLKIEMALQLVSPALHPARKRVSVVPAAFLAGPRRQAAIPLLSVSTAGQYLDFMHFSLMISSPLAPARGSILSPF